MEIAVKNWLEMKRQEWQRIRLFFGPIIDKWDVPTFLKIIGDQEREIRRLKTTVERMAKEKT